MLLHLACTAAAAHADILNGTAKARLLVTFKMCKRDEYICIHNCTADISFLAVLTIGNGNDDVIGSAKTVSDDYLTSRSNRIKAVDVCAVHVLESILAASGIKCVAVGKER